MREVLDLMTQGIQPPSVDDIECAMADIEARQGDPLFYVSNTPAIRELQARAVAYGYNAPKDNKAFYSKTPVITPEQQYADMVAAQKRQSSNLAGSTSIHATISLAECQLTDCLSWLQNQFHGNQIGLILGKPGCGKTHSVIAYTGNQMLRKRQSGKFATAYEVLQAIHRRQYDWLDQLEKVPFLIIDDLGTQNADFKGNAFISHFEHLITQRHEHRRVTLVTGNITTEQFKQTFGERVVSRIAEVGKVYESNGPDLRRNVA